MAKTRGNTALTIAFAGSAIGAICVVGIVLSRTSSLTPAVELQSTKLWNAAHNDAIMPADEEYDGRDMQRVNQHIAQWQQMADSQGNTAVSYKGAMTQKLYIVPQANVLTGTGQKVEASNGKEDVQAEKKADAKAAAKTVQKSATAARKTQMQQLWNAAQDHDGSALFAPTVHVKKGVPLMHHYQHYNAAEQVSYIPSAAKHAKFQQLWDAASNDGSLESTRQKMGMGSPQRSSARKQRDMSGVPRNYLSGMDYHPMNYLGGYGW